MTGREIVAAAMRRHGFTVAANSMLFGETDWHDALPLLWWRFEERGRVAP